MRRQLIEWARKSGIKIDEPYADEYKITHPYDFPNVTTVGNGFGFCSSHCEAFSSATLVSLENMIEFVTTEALKPIQITTNYSAQVLPNGDVEVGCQSITFSKLKEVYDAALKMRS